MEAIEVEQVILNEAVGCQDQVFAAVGGFRLIEFRSRRDFVVHSVPLSADRLRLFESHLLLLHTGIKRRAASVANNYVKKLTDRHGLLRQMRDMVDTGYAILTGNTDLRAFGELLDEAWRLKSELDNSISNDEIRSVYETGKQFGAWGGKLLGAGGGGCMLFFVAPDKRQAVRDSLPHLEEIPVRINSPGSHIIHA
jgi:D-glycero-alpha-D-manno-heptose-7-phosphate kinase